MTDVWAVELERVAASAGVEVEALVRLVGSGREIVAEEPPLDEAGLMRRLGRLLVAAAEELEAIEDEAGRLASARGGLLGLTAIAALLEAPKLAEWTARLAASDELAALAPDAARMLRGEAFEMVWTQSLIELRACDWRWPERREAKLEQVLTEMVATGMWPGPPVVREPQAEPVPEPEVVAEARREPDPEPEPEPEPEPDPTPQPPLPEPIPVVLPEPAPRRTTTRALVGDPSGIAASFLARLLVSRGVDVTLADSAERVSTQAAHGSFDLVFVAAEWPLVGRGSPEALIVRLVAEGKSHRPRPGERTLRKPPAEEEVDLILEAWAARRGAR